MSDIDRIIDVTITREASVPSVATFGNLNLAAEFLTTDVTPVYTGRIRIYTSITEIGAAFGLDSVVYDAASKIFSQSPSPSELYIGRKLTGGEGSETWDAALAAMNLENPDWYGALCLTYIEAEQQVIATWIETNKKLAGISSGDSDIVDGTGDIAEYINTNSYDRSFVLYHPDTNPNNIADVVYDADFVDLNSIDVVINGITVTTVFDNDQADTMDKIKADIEADSSLVGITVTLTDVAGANRSLQIYWLGVTLVVTSTVTLGASQPVATITYDTNDNYPAAAWMGKMFPKDPGSATWAYKTLTNVTTYILTETQTNTALGKRANIYKSIANVKATEQGTTGLADGYMDITRGIDWLGARIQELVFGLLTLLDKVPYTNAGIQTIVTKVKQALQEGVDNNFLAEEFVVTAPQASEVSAQDKANRLLPDVNFTATLAGAIQKVVINGVVSF